MPSIFKLAMAAATLFGVLTAANHNPSVDFVRFSQPNCPADYQIGRHAVDLDGNQCHTFPASTPPFESFKTIGIISKIQGTHEKFCHIVIFDQPKCLGHAFSINDLLGAHEQCANVPNLHGMSAKLVCEKRPVTTLTSSIPTTTSTPTSTSTSIPAPSSTTTTTVAVLLPTSTITATAEMTTMTLSAMSSPCTHGCS
ncbi:hypothetical protein B0A55_05188 [Friedmanniomyces simplex]|uniref:Uncharacterized protein n=1 Tax=Friedmanniomyces simplex TaxID=329884 RepID=A0A4U0XH81_9PEZI|nr:hypothetical protein B0A55_05188 [Friedmanniomyces simplex]